jgi:hypothetical protein
MSSDNRNKDAHYSGRRTQATDPDWSWGDGVVSEFWKEQVKDGWKTWDSDEMPPG